MVLNRVQKYLQKYYFQYTLLSTDYACRFAPFHMSVSDLRFDEKYKQQNCPVHFPGDIVTNCPDPQSIAV